jgi:hypothetical protein
LESKLENKCGGASSTNLVAIKDITTRACDMTIVQNASAKAKCKIDALQEAVVKSDTTLASTATGASLGSLLFGGGIGGIVGGIVIVLILIGIAYYIYKKRTAATAQLSAQIGGVDKFSLFDKKTYPVAIILTLLILVVIFIAYSRTPDTQLTVIDLTNFQSKLSEAKKIANLGTTSNTVSDTYQSQSYEPNYEPSYEPNYEPSYYSDYNKSPQVHNYESTQVQHHSSRPIQMVYQNPTDMFEQAYQTGPVYYDDLKSYYGPLI